MYGVLVLCVPGAAVGDDSVATSATMAMVGYHGARRDSECVSQVPCNETCVLAAIVALELNSCVPGILCSTDPREAKVLCTRIMA